MRDLLCCLGFPLVVASVAAPLAAVCSCSMGWFSCCRTQAQQLWLSCSKACGTLPGERSSPRVLHWQADSRPLSHQGDPKALRLVEKRCRVHTQPPLRGMVLSTAVSWAVKTEFASLPEEAWKGHASSRVSHEGLGAPGQPQGSLLPSLRCCPRDGSSQTPFPRKPP